MVPNWIVLGEGAFRSFRLSLLSCFLGESNVTCSTFIANVLLLWVSCSEVKPAAMSDRKRMSIGAVTHAHFGITIECHNWKRSQGPSCTMVGVGKQGTSVGMIFWRTWAGLPEASGISFFKVNWIGNVTASFAENDLAWFHTTAEWLIELAVPRRNLNTFDLYDYVTRKCFRLWFQTFVLDLLVETAMMCHLRPVE